MTLWAWFRALAAVPGARRAAAEQERADEEAYWEFEAAGRAIRAKYDPEGAWNEATVVPDAFLSELHALNLQYRGMLTRRNGWTPADFEPSRF